MAAGDAGKSRRGRGPDEAVGFDEGAARRVVRMARRVKRRPEVPPPPAALPPGASRFARRAKLGQAAARVKPDSGPDRCDRPGPAALSGPPDPFRSESP